jgi:hypothetical protein
MLMGWSALTGFAAVVFAVLSVIGQPHRRVAMRLAAVASAMLCGGFLAGPPLDLIAGGIVLALILFLVVQAVRGGGF